MDKFIILQEVNRKLSELQKIVTQLIIEEMPTHKRGDEVMQVVSRYSGLTIEQLTASRGEGLMFYKRILCYILLDYKHMPLQEIADYLSLKSHATIKHHADKMRWWMSNWTKAPDNIVKATREILKLLGYEEEQFKSSR